MDHTLHFANMSELISIRIFYELFKFRELYEAGPIAKQGTLKPMMFEPRVNIIETIA